MSTETLTLTVPASLAQELEQASQEFIVEILERGLQQLKIEHALDQYAHGGIPFGAAAHQAGVSQSDLSRYAYARGMEPLFNPTTVIEELG
jgi:hypothetical protein